MRRYVFASAMLIVGATAGAGTNDGVADFIYERADGAAYYDWRQDITWVTDANLAKTSGYHPTGHMPFDNASVYIDSLNTASYLGVNTWRFPRWHDPGLGWARCGGDRGKNVDPRSGELAFMYYTIMELDAESDCAGNPVEPHGMLTWGAASGLPFSNVEDAVHDAYWYGQEYAPDTSRIWVMHFEYGAQHADGRTSGEPTWPVLDGDPLYASGDGLPEDVPVDVDPTSGLNEVDPASTGQVEVAILSTSVWAGAPISFAASDVDLSTVRFGSDEAMPVGTPLIADVDGDSIDDITTQFIVAETGIVCEDSEVMLYGETYGAVEFTGVSAITTTGDCDSGGCHP